MALNLGPLDLELMVIWAGEGSPHWSADVALFVLFCVWQLPLSQGLTSCVL